MPRRNTTATRTTTQRGLGGPHQTARKLAVAALRDGDPCARCELRGVYHPMYRELIRFLDLDDFPGRVFGGPQIKRLSYRRCNRQAGGILGNKIKAARRRRPTVYNRW